MIQSQIRCWPMPKIEYCLLLILFNVGCDQSTYVPAHRMNVGAYAATSIPSFDISISIVLNDQIAESAYSVEGTTEEFGPLASIPSVDASIPISQDDLAARAIPSPQGIPPQPISPLDPENGLNVGAELPALTNQYTINRLHDRVTHFIVVFFPDDADILIVDRERNRQIVRVENVRGMALTTQNYWERYEISSVVVINQINNASNTIQATLFMEIDGYFATGIGSRQPSIGGYQSMEPSYEPELRYLADRMANFFRSSFVDS